MAISLLNWDIKYGSGGIKDSNNKLDWEYYKAMAYDGLSYDKNPDPDITEIEDTDSFKALVPNKTDRDKIKNIIKNEVYGNKKSKGNKCN